MKTKFLQVDVGSVQKRCVDNYMELNIHKTKIISAARNSIHFNHCFGDVLLFRTDCIKHFDVMLDSKLYFIVMLIMPLSDIKDVRVYSLYYI